MHVYVRYHWYVRTIFGTYVQYTCTYEGTSGINSHHGTYSSSIVTVLVVVHVYRYTCTAYVHVYVRTYVTCDVYRVRIRVLCTYVHVYACCDITLRMDVTHLAGIRKVGIKPTCMHARRRCGDDSRGRPRR